MKKIMLFYCALCLVCGQASGQNIPQKWQIRFAPLHFINPDNPALQAGIQYQFATKWAGSLEFGLQCRVIGWNLQPDKQNPTYWKLRSEIKYFYHKSKKPYLSLEHTYIPQRYEKYNASYIPLGLTSNNEQDFDKAKLKHHINAFALKWGKEIRYKSGLLFEYYFGFGARIHQISYLSVENPTPVVSKVWREGPAIIIDNSLEGTQVNMQIPLGVKLGYVF